MNKELLFVAEKEYWGSANYVANYRLFVRLVSMFIAEYINFARVMSCENGIDIKMSILDLHNNFSHPTGPRHFQATYYGISLGFISLQFSPTLAALSRNGAERLVGKFTYLL